MNNKSTIEEIKARFDNDVERFANLETGQTTTIDAVVSLELITESAQRIRSEATQLLDVGCGAGNYTLKMLSKIPSLNCTLVDLSMPMLERASQRATEAGATSVTALQGDIREIEIEADKYDIILAGAVLHHLRGDSDWESVFAKLYRSLKMSGCMLVSDLVVQESKVLTDYFNERYTDYLTRLADDEFAQRVMDCIDKEDTPRPLTYQTELMRRTGFRLVDVLHKNATFAAYCGVK